MKEFICPVCGYHTQGTERNEEVLNVMNLIGAVAGGPEYKAYCENCGNTLPVVDDINEIVEITNVDGTAKTDERALARIGRKVIIGELEVGKRAVLPYVPEFTRFLHTSTVAEIVSTADGWYIIVTTLNSVYKLKCVETVKNV